MKIRRFKALLFFSVGLCVVSFLHYYKALNQIPMLKELSNSPANLKHLAALSRFLWKEKFTGGHDISKNAAPGVQSQAFLVWRPSGVKSQRPVEVSVTGS